MMMQKKRVYIAGHRGMVGSAIYRQLAQREDVELIIRNREQLNLLDTTAVNDFFTSEHIDQFILPRQKLAGLWLIIIIHLISFMKT